MNLYSTTCSSTLNTSRICGRDSVNFAVELSKISFTNVKPNAVILVNKNEVFNGIAAAPLVHFPINGPILFNDGSALNKETLNEIERLSPKGYKGNQVILIGNGYNNIINQLKLKGFSSKLITGKSHYEIACKTAFERKDFKNILLMSGEDYSEGIVSTYWCAHHGDPILFTQKNSIPDCTLDVIKNTRETNIYIIGSAKTISETVEHTLSKLPNVKRLIRISGNTPYEIAVNFSKYKSIDGSFGWGRNYKSGHAFAFGTLDEPMEITASVILAHMGKHCPLLLIKNNGIPEATADYMKEIKPSFENNMIKPPFMHGFILGNNDDISYDLQLEIENSISVNHTSMEMRSAKETSYDEFNQYYGICLFKTVDIHEVLD